MSTEHPSRGVQGELSILIVDDDRRLHEDYERCLGAVPRESPSLAAARAELFRVPLPLAADEPIVFRLEHAYSGDAGLRAVELGLTADQRYCVAFVDMRMPPGWNGVDTIAALWRVDPAIQIVICTAYSDFTWDKVIATVGRSEGLHLLRKPFSEQQVRRFAEVLARKWQLSSAPRERAAAGSR